MESIILKLQSDWVIEIGISNILQSLTVHIVLTAPSKPWINTPSKPSKTMVSTTEVAGRGGNTRNSPAAKKNQPKPNNKKTVGFKGDAKVESVLHAKKLPVGLIKQGKS